LPYTPFDFHEETPAVVRESLMWAYEHEYRVRLFYGDVQTGKSWMDENDMMGRVGKSTGIKPIPLLVVHAADWGGGSIPDHCIIRLDRQMDDGSWTTEYQHPRFHIPAFILCPITERLPEAPDLTYEAVDVAENKSIARFPDMAEAVHWAGYILGVHHEWVDELPIYEDDDDEV
jgi:hypothetical protein